MRILHAGVDWSAVAMLEEANNGAPSCVSPRLEKPGPIQLTDNEIRERMQRQYLSLWGLCRYSSRHSFGIRKAKSVKPFTYVRARAVAEPVSVFAKSSDARYIGGGTNCSTYEDGG